MQTHKQDMEIVVPPHTNSDLAVLALRVSLGVMYLAHSVLHGANGWVFTAANGGWEYPAFLVIAAVTQALLGDGKFAISTLIPNRNIQGATA